MTSTAPSTRRLERSTPSETAIRWPTTELLLSALLGGLYRNVGRYRKQSLRRKKTAAAQRKNVARSLMSLFKRGLRRIRFCLQRLIAPPPLWTAWKNDGW